MAVSSWNDNGQKQFVHDSCKSFFKQVLLVIWQDLHVCFFSFQLEWKHCEVNFGMLIMFYIHFVFQCILQMLFTDQIFFLVLDGC